MYRKMIVYNRGTGDFTMYLDSENVSVIATYGKTVESLNQRVYQLLIAPSKDNSDGSDTSTEPAQP